MDNRLIQSRINPATKSIAKNSQMVIWGDSFKDRISCSQVSAPPNPKKIAVYIVPPHIISMIMPMILIVFIQAFFRAPKLIFL